MGQDSTRLPWFPFYPQDFLTSQRVLAMSYEEIGIYIVLLAHQWIEGSIPADPDQAKATLKLGCEYTGRDGEHHSVENVLASCFVKQRNHPSRLVNSRLDSIRRDNCVKHHRLSEAGRKGGLAQARVKPGSSILESESESESEPKKRKTPPLPPQVGVSAFGVFWQAYPKKRSKGQAEKAWMALKPSEQLQGQILAALKRATTSVEWAKDGGRFIPHAATWLRAKGWEDELHDDPLTTWKPP